MSTDELATIFTIVGIFAGFGFARLLDTARQLDREEQHRKARRHAGKCFR